MSEEERCKQIIDYVDNVPWGDIENSLETIELALRLSMEATRDAFQRWEQEGEGRFGGEFELSPTEVAELDQGTRLALVARLLRDVGAFYGVETELTPNGRLGQLSPRERSGGTTSVGHLVHGLLELTSPRSA